MATLRTRTIIVVPCLLLLLALAHLIDSAPAWAQPHCPVVGCPDLRPIPCNVNGDCPSDRPLCRSGMCRDHACSDTPDCAGQGICDNGQCRPVECTSDDGCQGGDVCVRTRCVACRTNQDCGARGVCQDHRCSCVECTNDSQCAPEERCDGNACVPRCGENAVFVSTTGRDGRVCSSCANVNWRCFAPECIQNGLTACAQGFCVRPCEDIAITPSAVAEYLEELGRMFTRPVPAPDCPYCVGFEMIGVRRALERAGLEKTMRLRLLDDRNRVVADFGTHKPSKGSWATIPEVAQPAVNHAVPKSGGCGYVLEIGDAGMVKVGRARICLNPRR